MHKLTEIPDQLRRENIKASESIVTAEEITYLFERRQLDRPEGKAWSQAERMARNLMGRWNV